MVLLCFFLLFFFFNDTATTEIYTLSLHDALPIWGGGRRPGAAPAPPLGPHPVPLAGGGRAPPARLRDLRGRSEEHTSELQSRSDLVCRLLLEKKKYILHVLRSKTASTHAFGLPAL